MPDKKITQEGTEQGTQESTAQGTVEFGYELHWRRNRRHGHRCKILTRGKPGPMVQIQFEDGLTMVVLSHCLRAAKKKPQAQDEGAGMSLKTAAREWAKK